MFLGSFLNFGIETCWTNSLLRFIKMFMKSRGWTLTRWARSYSDVMMLVDWCWSTKRIQACRVMLEKEWKHGNGTAVFWWEGYLFQGPGPFHSEFHSTISICWLHPNGISDGTLGLQLAIRVHAPSCPGARGGQAAKASIRTSRLGLGAVECSWLMLIVL